ncbi:hypothetical protein [Aquimarina litoralis]|uniref:hypothetical protein n=1 Tax=Aquimarina litoralis TaxID=584605 RepID=UPI001C5774CD|nr:hypothetical protein [Aquimarina litoralis]MBW1297917.1 hypothetical protein [Aquimarina litoralis]
MKKIIFFILVLISFNEMFSQEQEAEIFFKDGTSLEGYGMIHKLNEIKFRISLDDDYDVWTYLMVKSIVFFDYNHGGMYEYVTLKPNESPKLLEVLSEGNINLYADVTSYNYYTGGNFQDRSSTIQKKKFSINKLYVKRTNEKHPTALTGNFRKKAQKYFSDCKEIVEKLKTGEFRKTNANEMVDYYNDFCWE